LNKKRGIKMKYVIKNRKTGQLSETFIEADDKEDVENFIWDDVICPFIEFFKDNEEFSFDELSYDIQKFFTMREEVGIENFVILGEDDDTMFDCSDFVIVRKHKIYKNYIKHPKSGIDIYMGNKIRLK
jgi:hypothetical protein